MPDAESGSPANKPKRGKRKRNRDDAPVAAPAEGLSIEERVRRRQRGEAAPAAAQPSSGVDGALSENDEEVIQQPAAPTGRPSLGELQSRTNGWDCPRCGCRDWRVINSYLCADGTRHRRQYCRHCYFSRITVEAPAESD